MSYFRILILTNKPPFPATDGGTIASLGIIRSLAKAGHQLTVLSMNTLKHHSSLDNVPADLMGIVDFQLVEVPAPITLTGLLKNLLFSTLPYNAERFVSKLYRTELTRILETEKFDVVQLEGLYLYPYVDIIRKLSNAKIVYRSHNVEHEIWERTSKQTVWYKKPYLKLLLQRIVHYEQKAINQYDLLLPITERDRQKLIEMGNTKPSITLPAGVDIHQYNPIESTNNNSLFFLGALDWGPNQEGIIWFLEYCWKEIRHICPKATLTIAGRNAPGWFIRKIANHEVDFVGEVENAHLFMLTHGIMIVPLLSGSGMRIKIIEGMSLKKPIITTPIGCEGIDARNGQEILISNTDSDFITNTVRLLRDDKLQSSISENCYKFVRDNYSNETLALRLINFYKAHIR
jgi:polysaccharide biosynthesis protein PslH